MLARESIAGTCRYVAADTLVQPHPAKRTKFVCGHCDQELSKTQFYKPFLIRKGEFGSLRNCPVLLFTLDLAVKTLTSVI